MALLITAPRVTCDCLLVLLRGRYCPLMCPNMLLWHLWLRKSLLRMLLRALLLRPLCSLLLQALLPIAMWVATPALQVATRIARMAVHERGWQRFLGPNGYECGAYQT